MTKDHTTIMSQSIVNRRNNIITPVWAMYSLRMMQRYWPWKPYAITIQIKIQMVSKHIMYKKCIIRVCFLLYNVYIDLRKIVNNLIFVLFSLSFHRFIVHLSLLSIPWLHFLSVPLMSIDTGYFTLSHFWRDISFYIGLQKKIYSEPNFSACKHFFKTISMISCFVYSCEFFCEEDWGM